MQHTRKFATAPLAEAPPGSPLKKGLPRGPMPARHPLQIRTSGAPKAVEKRSLTKAARPQSLSAVPVKKDAVTTRDGAPAFKVKPGTGEGVDVLSQSVLYDDILPSPDALSPILDRPFTDVNSQLMAAAANSVRQVRTNIEIFRGPRPTRPPPAGKENASPKENRPSFARPTKTSAARTRPAPIMPFRVSAADRLAQSANMGTRTKETDRLQVPGTVYGRSIPRPAQSKNAAVRASPPRALKPIQPVQPRTPPPVKKIQPVKPNVESPKRGVAGGVRAKVIGTLASVKKGVAKIVDSNKSKKLVVPEIVLTVPDDDDEQVMAPSDIVIPSLSVSSSTDLLTLPGWGYDSPVTEEVEDVVPPSAPQPNPEVEAGAIRPVFLSPGWEKALRTGPMRRHTAALIEEPVEESDESKTVLQDAPKPAIPNTLVNEGPVIKEGPIDDNARVAEGTLIMADILMLVAPDPTEDAVTSVFQDDEDNSSVESSDAGSYGTATTHMEEHFPVYEANHFPEDDVEVTDEQSEEFATFRYAFSFVLGVFISACTVSPVFENAYSSYFIDDILAEYLDEDPEACDIYSSYEDCGPASDEDPTERIRSSESLTSLLKEVDEAFSLFEDDSVASLVRMSAEADVSRVTQAQQEFGRSSPVPKLLQTTMTTHESEPTAGVDKELPKDVVEHPEVTHALEGRGSAAAPGSPRPNRYWGVSSPDGADYTIADDVAPRFTASEKEKFRAIVYEDDFELEIEPEIEPESEYVTTETTVSAAQETFVGYLPWSAPEFILGNSRGTALYGTIGFHSRPSPRPVISKFARGSPLLKGKSSKPVIQPKLPFQSSSMTPATPQRLMPERGLARKHSSSKLAITPAEFEDVPLDAVPIKSADSQPRLWYRLFSRRPSTPAAQAMRSPSSVSSDVASTTGTTSVGSPDAPSSIIVSLTADFPPSPTPISYGASEMMERSYFSDDSSDMSSEHSMSSSELSPNIATSSAFSFSPSRPSSASSRGWIQKDATRLDLIKDFFSRLF
ncbi:predicted protein [Postia placenta Mad-698-R]|uniref:Uncharacterized protein n=1 Tax=Postia placenta MAD-698-R-SB12 TaxID=670580 RepID=A0A1X6N6Z0_9APHY|nr:hypothetical protein POSPLADRAFT_1032657 [Postia placenta MAD-698-R-SB12]EED80908.1 predicted protein [Postia placenta Mad-698-R]OSX64252.1 hypothetical protein POSPLADRAFT_1032657 [Postia placenta MAD-698-R-SB12]